MKTVKKSGHEIEECEPSHSQPTIEKEKFEKKSLPPFSLKFSTKK
jgi:hypothetical protein